MTTRAELRKTGQKIRQKLGLDNQSASSLLPGLDDLQDEMIFGRVWSRPGLSIEDRMLATLSAQGCRLRKLLFASLAMSL